MGAQMREGAEDCLWEEGVRLLSKLRWWAHDYLGWHAPGQKMGFDGASFQAYCRFCGKHILQDSQGNWFRSSRP